MSQREISAKNEEDPFAWVCAQLAETMEELQIPGAAIGILHDGQEQAAGLGVTNVEHPLPVTADTFFQAGSITKTYTATAILRLVEAGKLDLDAPLRSYLPDLRLSDVDVAERVTLTHLLTHTCGWQGDYFEDLGRGEEALQTMVDRLAGLPQVTPLGEVWSYNNAGFYLAGRMIEVVTGMSYETAIKELVLEPLNMEHSFFFADEIITHRFVVGHQEGEDGPMAARPWAIGRAAHPAGGIISTVGDLLRFARFHMGNGKAEDGTRVLSPQSLRQMQTPLYPATGLEWIGLSWFITEVDGYKILEHPGGTNGQASLVMMAPEKGFALALLTNSDLGRRLVERLKHTILERYTDVRIPEAVPMAIDRDGLEEYTGRYSAAGQVVNLISFGDDLFLSVTYTGGFPTPDSPPRTSRPAMRIGFYARDRLLALEPQMKGVRGEFVRDKTGKVKWLRLMGRVHTRE